MWEFRSWPLHACPDGATGKWRLFTKGNRRYLAVAATVLLLSGPLQAATAHPKPLQGGSTNIGVVSGSGFCTIEPEGFRVVITLTKGTERPIRFEAVLPPSQSVILSAPREIGADSEVVEIVREGDELVVTRR